MLTRREALLGGLALASCAPNARSLVHRDEPRFAALEGRIGGRVGVAALNTGSGEWITHRANERFAMCSTFKWLLAAHMLYLDMHMPGFREQRVMFSDGDLLDYAPVARENLARGWMTVEEMCAAIVVTSDNTCANLLLVGAGGPEGLTHFLRSNGDSVTRLDRTEPALNENAPGDERDTTTPDAMVRTMQRFLLDDRVLNPASRERLIGWMIECRTGRERLRAGLPADWRAGDKTGTSVEAHNATADVAIAWPPGRAPILIAAYLSDSNVELPGRNAAHAEIARLVADRWS
jgi:beta-lactamase class A